MVLGVLGDDDEVAGALLLQVRGLGRDLRGDILRRAVAEAGTLRVACHNTNLLILVRAYRSVPTMSCDPWTT